MTAQDLEALAVGIPTGYKDRNGTPIKVGDEVIYYKKAVEYVGRETAWQYPKDYIYGSGVHGYVYTGKVTRHRHKVTFTFEHGYKILEGGQSKYLFEKDKDGNLITILVDNEKKNPKLSFKDVVEVKE